MAGSLLGELRISYPPVRLSPGPMMMAILDTANLRAEGQDLALTAKNENSCSPKARWTTLGSDQAFGTA